MLASERERGTDLAMFGIDIDLTVEGLQNVDGIVKLMCDAIAIFTHDWWQLEDGHAEYQRMLQLAFNYLVGDAMQGRTIRTACVW